MMHLHVLPERASDAAGNMAVDFLLLQRYAPADVARFRHYTWRSAAFTFGYAQRIADVRADLPAGEPIDLTRRATGGGLVDHRADWTYALVLPRVHPLFQRPGPVIYQAVHEALATALGALGARVALARVEPDEARGVCFARAEIHDLVHLEDDRKVAGAALKRGKHGILLQGSVARRAAREITDWAPLAETFSRALGAALELMVVPQGWPEFDPEEEEILTARYASAEWIEQR
jgi:lipoate-protein ligase A